jgi:hypothetical protein
MIRRSQYKVSGWKKMQSKNGSNMEKDTGPRTCKDEHEQVNMSMTKSFLEYYVHVHIIVGEYFVTHTIKSIFVDMEEYFAMCPWMNDLYG